MDLHQRAFVFLAQTDTTAGLLSLDSQKLNLIKSRPENQPILIESTSLHTLKSLTCIPTKHKNRVRKSKKTTFIYPNQKAIRIIQEGLHYRFLHPYKMLFSTSANKTQKPFQRQWAEEQCDVIVLDKRGLQQAEASKIYKINQNRIKRIR